MIEPHEKNTLSAIATFLREQGKHAWAVRLDDILKNLEKKPSW